MKDSPLSKLIAAAEKAGLTVQPPQPSAAGGLQDLVLIAAAADPKVALAVAVLKLLKESGIVHRGVSLFNGAGGDAVIVRGVKPEPIEAPAPVK
jgi:hypothetical protein